MKDAIVISGTYATSVLLYLLLFRPSERAVKAGARLTPWQAFVVRHPVITGLGACATCLLLIAFCDALWP